MTKIDIQEWLSTQLAEVVASLEGPLTQAQWDRQWIDISIAAREDGESEADAAVLADHLVVEHFGPRP